MRYYQNKKILVTGAGGFIGSHLIERLVKLGTKVRAFVRYNSRNDWGLIEFLPKEIQVELEIFTGDLKDSEAVRKAVKDCEIVFHLGALIAIPYSYINPMDFVQTNVNGTANIVNACREYGVARLVHTSTSEVYGTAQYTPIDEKHPLQGQSPYSASKIGADKIVESQYLAFGLPATTIRPFNTYGPRQSARAIIPTIITQALAESEVKLGSLWPTRDLTYIDDTVEGFIKIGASQKAIGEVINIGLGEGISIKELVNSISKIIGKELKIKYDSLRVRPKKSEVGRLICNNIKAKKILNWQPKVSLAQGLEKTIVWISENLGRYKKEIYNL
ncbi:NAD-dependent epimerase/dehydratase family protein [bacterium]|nr:MAG: NAD-dependent epimerase/dehydratase family protein [bacterium]